MASAAVELLARNARDLASCVAPDSVFCPSPLALVLAIAAPHFLYALVWLSPSLWQAVFGKRSVDAFATAGVLGKGAWWSTASSCELRAEARPRGRAARFKKKHRASSTPRPRPPPAPSPTKKTAIQFTAVLLWFACNRSDGGGGLCVLGSFAPSIPLAAWLAALLFGGYGQALNVGIFRAIGRDGVYYGARLGRRIPWVKGWPFDAALAHPQYAGSAMSVWAGALLMGSARPAGTAVLVVYWTLLYVITALMEQHF